MSDELREQLADVQHAIWAHWMRYQFSQCRRPDLADDGSLIIPADKVQRWQRQMDTPYSDLTDKERDSDRHQADKVLSVVQPELDQLRAALAAATQRADAAERELSDERGHKDVIYAGFAAAKGRVQELEADAFVYRAILLTAALAAAYEWYSGYGQPLPPPVTLAQDAAVWFSDMAENARRAGAMAEADVNAMIRVQVTLEAMVAPQQATGGSEVQP